MYPETTMPAVFQNRVATHGDKAVCAFKNAQGVYEDISWNKLNAMVKNVGNYLISKGVVPQDKVALFSPNRYEWWVTDLGILSIGAANIPIYATNSAEESRYIIENSDAKICFVGTKSHLERVLAVKEKLPKLTDIIVFEDPGKKIDGVITLDEAMAIGSQYPDQAEFAKRVAAVKPGDLATLIYTSGTTGDPKGVMLSHSNFLNNVDQCYSTAPQLFDGREHILLSFLPLSHSLERTSGYYMPLYCAKQRAHKVVFAEDFAKILQNFQEVRPTFIISIPRLYEKIHTGILNKVADASPTKKALFNWAMSCARRNLPYICQGKTRTGLFALEYNLAYKLIFSKLKAALGMDRLEFAVSGGGPLSVSDAEFFLGMDITILEGFGLSETTPVTNVNRVGGIKPGTVGPAVKNTTIKISEDGEILIKGPQVMLGYYKNEAATKEVFTADGFFRSGDIGEIDKDGYLKITGRIKDLIITSGGKNISPQNIENSLKASAYIEQVAIIGDNRKYLSALIVPAFEQLEGWAKANGVAFGSRDELLQNEQVNKLIEAEIAEAMKDFARVEQIRKFKLLNAEWSQATDELTPTLKIKRRVINQKYAKDIEDLYPPEKESIA